MSILELLSRKPLSYKKPFDFSHWTYFSIARDSSQTKKFTTRLSLIPHLVSLHKDRFVMKALAAFAIAFLSLQLSTAAPNPLANPAFMPAGGLGPVAKPGINVLPNKPAVGPSCQSCILSCTSLAGGCEKQCLSGSWTSAACKVSLHRLKITHRKVEADSGMQTCLGPDNAAQQSVCANCCTKTPPLPAPAKPKTPTDGRTG